MVVEHLGLLGQPLSDRECAMWIAGEQHPRRQIRGGLQVYRGRGAGHWNESMGDSGPGMATRKTPQEQVQATLRDAVERTVSVGQQTRSRAQDAADELGRAAGRFRQQLEGRSPATHDDLDAIRAELRALGRRIEKLEKKKAAPKKK
jgi:hypothetical protein